LKLVKNQPAHRWGEAFPLGNGHMGAMVHGSLPGNRIELTENTYFSGEKSNPANGSCDNRKGASEAFDRMRILAAQGEYDKVHQAAEDFIGFRNNYVTNLPLGHLIIDYGCLPEEISDYQRSLDIMSGIATCSFQKNGHCFQEEIFVSHPDSILVNNIKIPNDSKIRISFQPGNQYGNVRYIENGISFTCYAYENLHCDKLCGVMALGYVLISSDGICSSGLDGMIVQGASEVNIYVGIITDFNKKKCSTDRKEELWHDLIQHVNQCSEKLYRQLKQSHQQDVKKYMKRLQFSIEAADDESTKIPFLYQYGRYLLLSSSREDSLLPAHLQGIWNDNVACRIGWTCDMHLDINTQMNYWPSEAVNLSETAEPLYRWISDSLVPSGTVTAGEAYGRKGWVGELVSNAWGYAAPYWATPIAPCPTGGIWTMMQMWEHYLYTQDKCFLADTFFPILESAVRFFQSYVFLDETTGYYSCGPSISPENSFLYHGKPYQISNGCTYEILMIRELFTVYRKACILLDRREKQDQEIGVIMERLIPYRIAENGTIAEWNHDLPQADPQHRHTSHLLGLYPFSQINPEETPLLCEAAERTLSEKLNPPEQWEDTGWARSMLLLYEARLQHGDMAYEHVKSMINNLLEPNGMIYHPPTRGANAFDHVYELDGNTGLTTGITEMLLQSHNGVIRLLPALPSAWQSGRISGLRARGNITIDLVWNKGRLFNVCLLAKKNIQCKIIYQGMSREIELKHGEPCQLEFE